MEEDERYYYALQANDSDCLRRLLSEGAKVDHVFVGLTSLGIYGRPSTWSGLHICCEKGHVECARVLLEAGADPNVFDRWNLTPLVYALQRQYCDIINLLLCHGADVNLVDRKYKTPLHFCVEHGDTECMRILLAAGADAGLGDTLQRTPLWICSSTDGCLDQMRLLLESGSCGMDSPDIREKRTPIQAAIMHASHDRMEYFRLLLKAGSDVNNCDVRNHTALMNVIWRSWQDGSHMTADDIDICKLILQHPDYKVNSVGEKTTWLQYGGPALNMATERGVDALVELMLQHGANPNITDKDNNSCVILAVEQNRIAILGHLITHNADLNLRGQVKLNGLKKPLTPLQCALINQNFDIATLLILAGCEISKSTYLWAEENTPDCLVSNCDFWIWLNDRVTEPKSLLLLSRLRVRALLGSGLQDKIRLLTLPPLTQKLIKMSDIVSSYV